MILRDLCDLYDRCSTDEGMTVSPFGWSIVKVAYRLRIDEAGELRNVIPYVSGDADKKSETIPMQVPEQEGRTSAIKPFFLCDTGEYLLAAGGGKAEDKFNRSAELHKEVLACCDSALAHAVVAFFGRGPQRNRLIEMVEQEKDVQGKFCVFEFAPDNGGSGTLVHEDAAIQNARYAYREKRLSKEEAPYGRCSVTGEYTRLANSFLSSREWLVLNLLELRLFRLTIRRTSLMGKREPITRPFLVIRHLRQGRPSDTLLETADIIPMWAIRYCCSGPMLLSTIGAVFGICAWNWASLEAKANWKMARRWTR